MKHKTFIKNAAIMTITALILRTIGIFFRIYMSNKIGAEGMGLYQLIFSIYVLGSTFATAGISIRRHPDDYRRARLRHQEIRTAYPGAAPC